MKISKHIVPHQALSGPVNVPLPPGAIVLAAQIDGVRPTLYVRGEGEPSEPRWFQALWTADRWPEGAAYVGTVRVVSIEGGAAVWHLVELPFLKGKETPF
jgi:hypothetical protein